MVMKLERDKETEVNIKTFKFHLETDWDHSLHYNSGLKGIRDYSNDAETYLFVTLDLHLVSNFQIFLRIFQGQLNRYKPFLDWCNRTQ